MEWMTQDIFIKLAVAFLFGLVLGLERSLKRKHASLKTAIVLTVTSCMVTMVSIEAAYEFDKMQGIVQDPMRLAAQLISGISFIGAGIILTRNSDAVSGLTTAALMWASVGFGIAIGAGFYLEAAAALVLIMLGVELFPFLIGVIGPERLNEKQLHLKISISHGQELTPLLKSIKAADIKVTKVKVRDVGNDHEMECMIIVAEKRYITDVYEAVKKIEGVKQAEVESM